MQAEIVVTGIGVVCPIGGNLESFREGLRQPRPAAGRLDLDTAGQLSPHQSRRLDRLSQLFLVAAMEAARQAQLDQVASRRKGVVFGTGLGCLSKTEAYLDGIVGAGLEYADPMNFADSGENAPAAHCAIALECRGPSLTVSQREISGESAVVLAALLLQAGTMEAVLVGAGDTTCTALAPVLDRLAPGLRPAEGAAALVLESAVSANARGAAVLGTLLGYAQACAIPRARLRVSHPQLISQAEQAALAMSGLSSEAAAGLPAVAPDAMSQRMGWCLGDGVLRCALALTLLADTGGPGIRVARAARGGTAGALVFGPPRPAS